MLLPFYRLYPFVLQNLIWVPTRLIFKFFLRWEVTGLDNVIKLLPGVIFASNHSSELDPFFVPAALPFLSRHSPVFYTSREKDFYRNSGWRQAFYGGLFFKLWGAYPVTVGLRDFEKSLADHLVILKNGGSLNIFPEGRKTRDGSIGPAKGGVAYLAAITGRPVVPVLISGVFRLTGKEFWFRRRRVVVRFGKPIWPDTIRRIVSSGSFADGVYEKAAALVMQAVADLDRQ
jgi:1-acyl-sn-glycerol-3-phosphate acyltransferase